MTTFAHTAQIASRNVNRVTIGSVCKAAAAVAVVGMISVFSIGQLSRAQFAPLATGLTEQSDLRSLLCRIDRRCPAVGFTQRTATQREASTNALDEADHSRQTATTREASANAANEAGRSDLRSLLCRIDRRCPAVDLAQQTATARAASAMMTAENRSR
jgi:hypothetical protein